MMHALVWLPLLALFSYLSWAGWSEYQKVQAYGRWAKAFDYSKYDIRAALGLKDRQLVWGPPTRSGPINLQTVSLEEVESVQLLVGGKLTSPDQPSAGSGAILLNLTFPGGRKMTIPFTELPLAQQWCKLLQQNIGN